MMRCLLWSFFYSCPSAGAGWWCELPLPSLPTYVMGRRDLHSACLRYSSEVREWIEKTAYVNVGGCFSILERSNSYSCAFPPGSLRAM